MIPKKLHQIWIGEVDLPPRWQRWCKTVKAAHPDWEYKMWTNEDIPQLLEKYPQPIKDYYELVKTNKRWAWITDVLRYIIIYEQGGIYMDCDYKMQAGKSLNDLPLDKELLLPNTVISTPEKPLYEIQNCFIGAAPRNDFMRVVVENIRKREYAHWKGLEIYAVKYFTTEYYLYLNPSYDGPLPFRQIPYEIKDKVPKEHLILDYTYFFCKDAKIAIHLNQETHVKQNLWKFSAPKIA